SYEPDLLPVSTAAVSMPASAERIETEVVDRARFPWLDRVADARHGRGVPREDLGFDAVCAAEGLVGDDLHGIRPQRIGLHADARARRKLSGLAQFLALDAGRVAGGVGREPRAVPVVGGQRGAHAGAARVLARVR